MHVYITLRICSLFAQHKHRGVWKICLSHVANQGVKFSLASQFPPESVLFC